MIRTFKENANLKYFFSSYMQTFDSYMALFLIWENIVLIPVIPILDLLRIEIVTPQVQELKKRV